MNEQALHVVTIIGSGLATIACVLLRWIIHDLGERITSLEKQTFEMAKTLSLLNERTKHL